MSNNLQQSTPTTAPIAAQKQTATDPKVRVFKLNDYEWWAGYDLDSIRVDYLKQTGVHPDSELGFDGPQEIPEDAMLTLRYYYDESDLSKSRSFREELDLLIANGQNFPCFFGGTES
jgi:hypothetical protein